MLVTLPTDEEILITHEFDAPPSLVYKAWTEPDLVRRWWSPRGQMTVCEIDLRVGGAWRYVLALRDGTEVAFNGEFREIVPDERLVHTEIYEGAPYQGDRPSTSSPSRILTAGRGSRSSSGAAARRCAT